MLEKVFYTSVLVSDQDRALDFYTNVLGLEKRVRSDARRPAVSDRRRQEGRVPAHSVAPGHGQAEPVMGRPASVTIETDDCKRSRSWHGVDFVSDVSETIRVAQFQDPDGNPAAGARGALVGVGSAGCPANATATKPPTTPTVSVVGEAAGWTQPDEAFLSITLSAVYESPGPALADVAKRSESLATMLDGHSPDDHWTTGVNVAEEFEPHRSGPASTRVTGRPRPVGPSGRPGVDRQGDDAQQR